MYNSKQDGTQRRLIHYSLKIAPGLLIKKVTRNKVFERFGGCLVGPSGLFILKYIELFRYINSGFTLNM